MTIQELLAKVHALSWDALSVIDQNVLIKELLVLRQVHSAIEIAPAEVEFQRALGVTRDEWFRILASGDGERLKLLDANWIKRYLPQQPITPGGVASPSTASGVGGTRPPIYVSQAPLTGIYPSRGWLGEYVHNFGTNMESPDSYIFWSGIACLSAVVRRKVWIRFGEGRLFPNFYIIFVSKAGTARKGPPIKAAMTLARTIPDVNMLDRTTTERFPHDLAYRTQLLGTNTNKIAGDAQGFICAEELVTFLDDQTYNSGILKFLIKWWDCQDDDATNSIKHNVVKLTNLHITMLGGTTPDWLSGALSHIVIGGGMLSRTIFVVEDRTVKRIAIPVEVDPVVKQRLAAELAYIDSINGEFSWGQDSREWIDKWYTKYRDYIEANEGEAPALERKQAHLIKLAMLMAMAEGAPLSLEIPFLEQANEILTEIEKRLPEAAKVLQATPMGRDSLRVLEHIRRPGVVGITWSDLLRKNSPYGLDKNLLRTVVDTLEESDQVEWDYVTGKGTRQFKTFWLKGMKP